MRRSRTSLYLIASLAGLWALPACGLLRDATPQGNGDNVQGPRDRTLIEVFGDTGTQDVGPRVRAEIAHDAAMRRGRYLYREACAACHGRTGAGDGPAAAALGEEPTDFTAGVYMWGESDQEIFQSISNGVEDTWMPGWGKLLGKRDRWSLVAHLRGLGGE